MPIFEFRCNSCGHVFEDLVVMASGDESMECPKCGAHDPEKLMSSFATGGGGSEPGGGGCKSSGPVR